MADMKDYYYEKGQQEEHKAELLLSGIIVEHHIDTNTVNMDTAKQAVEEAVEEAVALIADYNIYKDILEMSQYYYKQMPETTDKEGSN